MSWGKKKGGGSPMLARLAFLISLVALVLSWSAYRRTGATLSDLLPRTGGASISSDPVEDRAYNRLLGQRDEIVEHRNLDRVSAEVREVRADIEQSLTGASSEARARLRQLDADLERLEVQLREGGEKAVSTLDSALDKLRMR
jgi:hypothetical protein